MNEIICPNCHKAFKVDEAGYADILKQVRDHKFEEELQNRLYLAEQDKISAIKLAEANIKNQLQNQIANKEKEIIELKANNERTLTEQLAKKENQITEQSIFGPRPLVHGRARRLGFPDQTSDGCCSGCDQRPGTNPGELPRTAARRGRALYHVPRGNLDEWSSGH